MHLKLNKLILDLCASGLFFFALRELPLYILLKFISAAIKQDCPETYSELLLLLRAGGRGEIRGDGDGLQAFHLSAITVMTVLHECGPEPRNSAARESGQIAAELGLLLSVTSVIRIFTHMCLSFHTEAGIFSVVFQNCNGFIVRCNGKEKLECLQERWSLFSVLFLA